MFYIFVFVVKHLAQLWPLLLFAFIFIAVCHLVAKYTNISGSTITATLTIARVFSGSTANNGKLGKKPTREQCNAPEKSLYFEFIHPPVTVINTSVVGRNLLNKKETLPSTIKESSESSQTIDDQDSDKAGKTLSHENTVVRVDTTFKQQRRAAGIRSSMSSPLPGSPL
ncbi:unnamed protein product [Cercopithifilaria johnstoni]|uniref:Uncharacterized protein n=1 Tax=Cercopithifilaria johnstoni TaxID=2874296 RepID=A0A8J2MFF4_9BILA|nr:unnamed protein product [Cercopithifilaria johnstoni]